MTMIRWACAMFVLTAMTLTGCGKDSGSGPAPVTGNPAPEPSDQPKKPADPIVLFDGKSLGSWKKTEFAASSEPRVEDGVLIVPAGEVLAGVTWQSDPPATMSYEIELEAQRRDGNDFFCGLTFPVGTFHCSLIMGGWGGGMTGLSSLNGYDASENETSQWFKYESGKWCHVRVRVTESAIQVWLDGKQIIHVDTTDKQISTRIEVAASKPLGLATYQTTGAYRNIKLTKVDGPAPIEKKDDAVE